MIRSGNYGGGYCLQKHQHRLPYSGRKIEHLPGHYLYAPTTGDRSYKTFVCLRISRCNGQSGYRVVTAVTKKTITLWSNTVNELTASSFKFVRKAFQQLLPTAANLVRWKRISLGIQRATSATTANGNQISMFYQTATAAR